MQVCVCVSTCVRVCKCVCLSLLFILCSQESDTRHGLSLTTSRSGVCSCWFGSRTFWFNTMLFQTSTYTSLCMSTRMCVCSGACLHRCMYMSRTHNTHIHAHIHTHTTHTSHHNEFSTNKQTNKFVECWPIFPGGLLQAHGGRRGKVFRVL